jgi:hypothetical protein
MTPACGAAISAANAVNVHGTERIVADMHVRPAEYGTDSGELLKTFPNAAGDNF